MRCIVFRFNFFMDSRIWPGSLKRFCQTHDERIYQVDAQLTLGILNVDFTREYFVQNWIHQFLHKKPSVYVRVSYHELHRYGQRNYIHWSTPEGV